jgi:hypothetical protein
VASDELDAGGYYQALVGNAYAAEHDGQISWQNANLLGHVVNTPYTNGYNPVSVTLTGNAVWTVTDTCYLTALDIGTEAQISAATGTLSMTVDGVETPIQAGTQYQGEIVLSVG